MSRKRELAVWLIMAAVVASIVALFALPIIGDSWHGRYRAAHAAQKKYERILAEWEAENVTTEEVCNSSLTWLIAELRVPFYNSDRAIDSHIARISTIVRQFEGLRGRGTTWAEGGEEKAKAEVARIQRVYIDAIERARRPD